jgi:hypothetical protein
MAWDLLPVNYTDAVWSGLKRYNIITNDDGTVSFRDVTVYTNKEMSFFGAKEANRMNHALNTLMSMVENGSDLYTAFQNYFARQQGLFENEVAASLREYDAFLAEARKESTEIFATYEDQYETEIDDFKRSQKALFDNWFASIQTQLSGDVAGNLQNQIHELDVKTDGFEPREVTFSGDGNTIVEVYGNKRIETIFQSEDKIVQRFYENGSNILTKTILFGADGLSVREDVV